ncbi:TMEM175 family protein [Streptomyces pseudovenezuelae]|uniref:Membrane protein n=1 Tax=Streptomyces pseudovenezuelae TaxID=67350 RepID=A0ABT6LX07_9ACTN|nr:TMEM175 family protein [Streptomyces pseudovenezuelae]MDH6220324.1 putative membrane protein [Streptomyces pseudovenezuelae]
MALSTDQQASENTEIRAVAAERLTFFGDAVIAIALTLLALELPVPEGKTNSELWHSATDHREAYLAFMISFVVIAAHWRAHHRVFRYVTSSNKLLTSLTVYWLLMLVITPFATDVIGGDDAFQARFIFYAVVQFVACVLFVFMVREINREGLYRPGTPPDLLPRAMRRMSVVAAGFLVSIPVALATQWAYLCWILVPGIPAVFYGARRRRSGEQAADAD